jgi:heterotetrameric sarcosine oxidase beta subunit
MRYSIFSLLANAVTGHKRWQPAWRDAAPKPNYDVIIIGGGGHGLATAHYLAKAHGITNVAVLEKGWIGSGNVGRNTTIIRSNYLLPGNIPLYELSMQLWEGLEQDINYNAMVSQRGVLNLYHSDAQRDAYARRGNAMRMHGIDAELLDKAGVKKLLPYANFDDARFPIQGGLSTAWSLLAPGISMSVSPTRAGWCLAAISTGTIPTPSAATCRSSRTSARAAWRCCR